MGVAVEERRALRETWAAAERHGGAPFAALSTIDHLRAAHTLVCGSTP